MELNAQAYRQAFNEGLEGEALAQRVLYIVNHPPENIKLAAIDASRYQTFTNSLDDTRIKFIGGIGKIGEKARKSELVGDSAAPVMRVLLPFVRTPPILLVILLRERRLRLYLVRLDRKLKRVVRVET